jgi:archaellum biogenesis ATPase FlaH
MPPDLDKQLSVRFQPVSHFQSREIDWLWPGRFPLGKLVIIEGDPDMGKSLMAMDLCARVSTGRPFPETVASWKPAFAVLLEGEDDVERTIRPRLLAAGADVDLVVHVNPELNDTGEPLQFPSHLDKLDQVLKKTKAELLVISPLGAFLDRSVLSENDKSVRQALYPLANLAEKRHCTIALVRHLNKSELAHAMYRGGGSIAFVAACRSAWLIGRDPDKPARRVLAQVKNNLAPPQPSLAFEIEAHASGQPVMSWLGIHPLSATDLLRATGKSLRPAPAHDRAEGFLVDLLAGGPKTSGEVWTAAQEESVSQRTIERVKKELDIRTARLMVDKKQICYWYLPHQKLPGSETEDDSFLDLGPWLAPLRAKFPPRTPLDDL